MTTISQSEPLAPAEPVAHETCEQCDAPVEATQRYCVVCGNHRRHVPDPASRFLSGATSRSRTVVARVPGAPRRRSFSLATALAIAAIPLALAVGVLIARSGNDSNSKLIAALRAQKPTVVNVGGGSQTGTPVASSTVASTATVTPSALTSTFSLQHGYAVELQALPAHGTTQSTVSAAEAHARAKGAGAVGLISQSAFKVTPAPAAGDYVIYSGQYSSSSAATSALAKLKHAFPAAKVISVSSTSTGGGSTKVLSTTQYGSAHQVTGYKPSASQISQGGQIANQVSKEIGNNYTKAQQNLPDAISVP
jgi:hypothetical protein